MPLSTRKRLFFNLQQSFIDLNVTALVVNGLNTLQLFANNFGGPSGIIFSATLTWVPCTGDRCFQAIPLANGLTNGTNVLATVGSESVGSCGLMGSDIWYVYVPTLCGTLTVDTCAGSNYDTVLTGWDGACGCPGLVQLACNDDTGGCGFAWHRGNLGSSISFSVAANQTYYISVGGFASTQGTFTLNMRFSSPLLRPTTIVLVRDPRARDVQGHRMHGQCDHGQSCRGSAAGWGTTSGTGSLPRRPGVAP